MKALRERTSEMGPERDRQDKVIPFPRQEEGEATARILADFASELRDLLAHLDDSAARYRALAPGVRIRREVLRFLADQVDWVEIHDLPRLPVLDRTAGRTLARTLAEEGLVEMERNETYPNMATLRITPAGREELRRMAVAEAMEYLQGGSGGAAGLESALRDALVALRRVGDLEFLR
jgi:hypothetical protein